MDAILEEEIEDISLNDKYKIIFAQGVHATYPQTNKLIQEYVSNGGILIAEGALMQGDTYGFQRTDTVITDIEIKEDPGARIGVVEGYGIKVSPSTYLQLGDGWESLATVAGRTILASRTMGEGKIYVVAGNMQDYARAELLRPILEQSEATKVASVLHSERDETVANIEVIRTQSDGLTGWYIANMNVFPRLIRLQSEALAGQQAINPLDKEGYPVSADGTVTLLIPPAKRFILISGSGDAIAQRFGTVTEKGPEQLQQDLDAKMQKLKSGSDFTRPSQTVNITDFANTGFDNQQGYRVDTVFIEDGIREFKDIPFHQATFGDLNFDVIRFDYNENKTAIALHSENNPQGPQIVENIPLNDRLSSIAFLIAGTHVKDGEKALTLLFNYEDGSVEQVAMIAGRDFGSWLMQKNSSELNDKAVWKNSHGNALYLYEWYNPEAAKPLQSLDLIAANGETVPVICAITARQSHFKREYENRIELSEVFTRTENPSMQWHEDGTLTSSSGFAWIFTERENLEGIDVSKLNLENAVLRMSISLSPDEYGNVLPFSQFMLGFRGLIDAERVTPGSETWTKTREGITPYIDNQRNSLAWYEIEWPVKEMLVSKETNTPIQKILSLMLLAHPRECPLSVRSLRIEYDN